MASSAPHFRGSGVRLTLPYVVRFSGLWILVTLVAVLVFALTSYLALADRLADPGRVRLLLILGVQTFFVVLAVFALGIFTTHRLAGPLIALRRACEDVRDGRLDRNLRFRRSDPQFSEVETAFNDMLAALRRQGGEPPKAG